MQLLGSVLLLAACAMAAPSHHGGATSYSSLVKHDEPHHKHYDSHGWSGHDGGYVSSGYGYGGGDYHGYDGHGHEAYHHPKYHFDYGVKDLHTGDLKNQWESRDGDKVKGSYSLKNSDGTTRIVDYSADDHHGFNAVVKTIGHAHHPQVYHKSHGHGELYGAAYSHGYGHDLGHYSHGHASSYASVKHLH